jgi:putative sterol carrier protein
VDQRTESPVERQRVLREIGFELGGRFPLHHRPEPGKDAQYMYLDLYHGKSPGAGVLKSLDEKDAGYVISASKSTWRKVIEGKLDPIQGMMTKQLKLMAI